MVHPPWFTPHGPSQWRAIASTEQIVGRKRTVSHPAIPAEAAKRTILMKRDQRSSGERNFGLFFPMQETEAPGVCHHSGRRVLSALLLLKAATIGNISGPSQAHGPHPSPRRDTAALSIGQRQSLLSSDLEVESRTRRIADRVVSVASRALNKAQGPVLIFKGEPVVRSASEVSPGLGHCCDAPSQAIQLVLRVHVGGSEMIAPKCSAKDSSAEHSSEGEAGAGTCHHDWLLFQPIYLSNVGIDELPCLKAHESSTVCSSRAPLRTTFRNFPVERFVLQVESIPEDRID
jgi:hypothetical protein